MISDSLPNASVPMASSSSHRDFAKKKKANRVAKLKQCKLDARREQWLSQVKNKGRRREEVDGRGQSVCEKDVRVQSTNKIDTKARNEEEFNGSMMHHCSDFESSPPGSPNSHTSSTLGSNDSGINFSDSSRSVSSSGQSSSSKSLCSEIVFSEDDEAGNDEDGCLDDWEAMADALAATDTKQQQCITNSECDSASSKKYEFDAEFESDSTNKQSVPGKSHAWRPDDAYRPHSLLNLTKQLSSKSGCKNLGLVPESCPICFEELDYTDWSFLPCPCGFRLCLFCHKKIIEGDGRCPICRNQYEQVCLEEPLMGGRA